MTTLWIIFAIIVAIEHFYIMILEMFFIKSSTAKRTFKLDDSSIKNQNIVTLFANQWLYNGFLGAGIIFSIFFLDASSSVIMTLFFLVCVIVAAIFGSITSSRSIIFKQWLPAIIAFCVIIWEKYI